MAGGRKLDLVGASGVKGRIAVSVVLFILLACIPLPASAAPPVSVSVSGIAELFAQQRWAEVVDAAGRISVRETDLEFYHGVALARLGRWEEARARLLAGQRLNPGDERFPVELGGVAFKQKQYPQAAAWLRQAIRLNNKSPYANDFLATIYHLQGNLEASLKYWNRIGKPKIGRALIQPGLRVDPVLLDRAFSFAPGEVLQLSELLDSRARIQGMGIFSFPGFRLEGREDGRFDIGFAAGERNGWGNGKLGAALSILRGAAYQTIQPEFFNLRGSAINLTSLVRWDPDKRRLQANLTSPLGGNPMYGYWLGVDLREERWDLRGSSRASAASLGALRLRRNAVRAGISSFRSGPWSWSLGGELSHRDYSDIRSGPGLQQSELLSGYQLAQMSQLGLELWRLPERRFEGNLQVSSDLGRIWTDASSAFQRLQMSVRSRWLPKMTGEDYAMEGRVRAGKIFGRVPFDELFILGLERDNPLWMRGHIGTREGRKGSAPMGHSYFLSNWEIDKIVYSDGLVTVKLSPFLDTGKIGGRSSPLGSRTWLWDTGAQAKLSVLGIGFRFVYGKDLRSGNNSFYLMAEVGGNGSGR
ncbi:MAG: tetratricopeptide repeat protein [Bryobacteraceae bacterium]|nr:tetratricopeptide repeat protein [Bryobacteraceae bacterium]